MRSSCNLLEVMDSLTMQEVYPISIVKQLPHHRIRAAYLESLAATGVIATTNPLNLMALQNLQVVHSIQAADICYASPESLDALSKGSSRTTSVESALASFSETDLQVLSGYMDSESSSDSELAGLAQQAPVIILLNAIFHEAYTRQASDIHIEATSLGCSLRYRIDGILYEQKAPPAVLFKPLVSRIKILAGMNIAERRLPQDGRIRINLETEEVDIRVATVPSIHGESVTLRLLSEKMEIRTLSDLGMSHETQNTLLHLLAQPDGMILATGPTGSGKTTTLYAALNATLGPDRKVITLEDPVEHEIDGITQIQVKPKIGFNFANGLRSILRHDPDVILVGEIRDTETASMAVHSSLTGHLVLSSLHTNDAPAAITRLRDMEIEPFLLSATVRGVLAQRLVRVLCSKCKRATGDPAQPFEPTGCEYCHGIGYAGRTGLFELLVTDVIDNDIIMHGDAFTIRRLARDKGMISLYEDGVRKVQDGITSLAEVERVLGGVETL